ncbi:MAG: ABC transporter permease [Clostridia bacterium]|nr:ABC transporter permease [Clostridia bacterium]
MRSVSAIFMKQARDMIKNRAVLIEIIVFPVLAFVLTELVAKPDETIPNSMFTIMFASIFTGMILLMRSAGTIAEDREHKSLRFLVMAGVKPHEYLLGSGGVILVTGAVVSAVFGVLGGFSGAALEIFMAVMMLSTVASMLLGAVIGILSKNQQAASGLGMPIAMILGFSPMIAMFNETAKKIFAIFYTMQVDLVVSDFSADLTKPFVIILANIAVLLVLFILAYKKKGLRD